MVEKSVLLLKAEPRVVVGISLHDLVALMAEVELVGGAVGVPALSQDEDVGRATEGIGEDRTRAEVDVRVIAGSLFGGRAVEVPDREIFGLVVLVSFKSLERDIVLVQNYIQPISATPYVTGAQ